MLIQKLFEPISSTPVFCGLRSLSFAHFDQMIELIQDQDLNSRLD